MPDPTNSDMLLAMGTGLGGGIVGAGASLLRENVSRRQAFAMLLAGAGFGSFVPPALMHFYQFNPVAAGFIGLCAGLMAAGLMEGFRVLGDAFGKKPWAFIGKLRRVLMGVLKEDEEKDKDGKGVTK